MKIEKVEAADSGQSLDSFEKGDCIRLVGTEDGYGTPFIGCVYIVAIPGGDQLAINLSDGNHRKVGKFVLEPTAKVVIE